MNDQKKSKKSRKKLFPRLYGQRALPPHSWEPQLAARQGAVNRRLLIIIISLVAVVLLLLLLFFGARFVGKAIKGGIPVTEVDMLIANDKIVVEVALPAGRQASGFYFELASTILGDDICNNFYSSLTSTFNGGFEEKGCAGGVIRYGDATLNDADYKSGTFTIAEFDLSALSALAAGTPVLFGMGVIDVYDADTGQDFFPKGGAFDLIIPEIQAAACGNNQIEPGETCDGNINSCITTTGYAGTQNCNAGCTGFAVCVTIESCGDTIKNGLEGCDRDIIDCSVAVAAGYSDSASCKSDCSDYDISTCNPPDTCGNGVKNGGEQCDDGNNNNLDACTTQCLSAACGDGFVYDLVDQVDQVEECDDGNINNNDGCTNSCQLAVCGDNIVSGNVDDGNVEECDGTDFAGKSCEDYSGVGAAGALSCNTVTDSNPCSIDSSNCQPPPPCTTGQTQNCGSEVGICTPGQQQCTAGGEWSECTGGIPPAGEETCDALDNDCDSFTDEGCPLTLTSPAFNKGDVIPSNYTCEVKENATSPPLLISNIPDGTELLENYTMMKNWKKIFPWIEEEKVV